MKNYYQIATKTLTGFALILLGLSAANQVLAVEPQLRCDKPVPAQINNLTRKITWQKIENATSVDILVYAGSDVDCNTADPKTALLNKTVSVIPTFYTLPASMTCGFTTVCMRSNCCNDRCDSLNDEEARTLFKNDDYCSVMAGLYIARGCKAPGRAVADSFRYKCADGSTVALPGTCKSPYPQTVGCAWECTEGFAGGQKTCGTNYDVQCGGPDRQIVESYPTYDLCSVHDSVNTWFDTSYQLKPPGVVSSTNPDLTYRWGCQGQVAKDSCLACRKPVCSPALQGQSITARPITDSLCLDKMGVKTGVSTGAVLSNDKKEWIWDCVGSDACEKPGEAKNTVSCSAKASLCGFASGTQMTYATFNKEAVTVKDGVELIKQGEFWCAGNGTAEKIPGKDFHYVEGLVDVLNWQCIYPGLKPITCNAGLVKCNPNPNMANFTQASFDNFDPANVNQTGPNGEYKFTPSRGFTYNLCLLGGGLLGWDGNGSMSKFLNSFTKVLVTKFDWQCVDARGGVENCHADEVACKKPPAGFFYKDSAALLKQGESGFCTTGSFTPPTAKGNGLKPDYWSWECKDVFSTKTNKLSGTALDCRAERLTCGSSVNGKSYGGWTDFLDRKNNPGCPLKATNDMATCTGLCNDKNLPVKVVLQQDSNSKQSFIWDCGEDKCSANVVGIGCGEANNSTHTETYWKQKILTRDDLLCQGGGTPKLSSNDPWSWQCVFAEATYNCSANPQKCGNLGQEFKGNGSLTKKYTPDNYVKNYSFEDLCFAGKNAKKESGAGKGLMAALNDFSKVNTKLGEELELAKNVVEPVYATTERRWYCAGDDSMTDGGNEEDQIQCGNLVTDCGAADAGRYDIATNGLQHFRYRIRPQTADGVYHASFPFDGKVPENMRCYNSKTGNSTVYLDGSDRGVFTWNCADDDGQVVNCEARKDCGWAGDENDKKRSYATVYYGKDDLTGEDAGCWTAENINNTKMGWWEAMARPNDQKGLENGYDAFNHAGDYQVKDTETEKGACPAGWEVPSNRNWHVLEKSLANPGSLCDEYRLSSNRTDTFQCQGAATVAGYGLNNYTTFDGDKAEGFWTKTSACSPDSANPSYNKSSDGKVDFCKAGPKSCYGKLSPANGKYLDAQPFYFGLNDDQVSRNNGDRGLGAWCNDKGTSGPALRLRCIKTPTTENKTTALQCGDMSLKSPEWIRADWKKFYDKFFVDANNKPILDANFTNVPIPAKGASSFSFVQFMPKNLTYAMMHDVEIVLYSNYDYFDEAQKRIANIHHTVPQDWEPNWAVDDKSLLIDLAEEQRSAKNGAYAIRHSGAFNPEGLGSPFGRTLTTTRLETGIFNLYMYWKCPYTPVDTKRYTMSYGSRHKLKNGVRAIPGSHWDTDNDKFCSFTDKTVDQLGNSHMVYTNDVPSVPAYGYRQVIAN